MSVSLLELQLTFQHAIRTGDATAMAPWLLVEDPEARVAIYRNNTLTNLGNALRSDYPVIEKLVGAEFFDHAARAYIAVTPSLSGDVGDYGRSFPDFLDHLPEAASLPYLGDVARLERAWADVFLAADTPANLDGIDAIGEAQFGLLRFEFSPAARLLSSHYPVLRIWQANQDIGADAEIRLDDGGESVLLRRQGQEVELMTLLPGEHTLLDALQSGACLSDAVIPALAAEEDFDLAACLQRHISGGTFARFHIGEHS